MEVKLKSKAVSKRNPLESSANQVEVVAVSKIHPRATSHRRLLNSNKRTQRIKLVGSAIAMKTTLTTSLSTFITGRSVRCWCSVGSAARSSRYPHLMITYWRSAISEMNTNYARNVAGSTDWKISRVMTV